MFCKTIILSNKENLTSNAPKGILSITSQSNCAMGKIRLYNLQTLPNNSKLGMYVNGEVIISDLTKRPNHYEFNLNKKIDLNKSIYCAIIDNSKGTKKVLLEGGNTFDFSFSDDPENAVNEAKDEELDNLISYSINNCTNCSSCENCEYKKYFYENYNNSLNTDTSFQLNNNNLKQTSSYPKQNLEEKADNLNTTSSPALDNTSSNTYQTPPAYINHTQNNFEENTSLNKVINPSQEKENNVEQENLLNTEQTKFNNKHNDENMNKDLLNNPVNQTDNHFDNSIQDYPFGEKIVNNNIKSNSLNSHNEIKENDKQDIPSETFLNDIIYQLDEMFKQYPNDDLIMSIIPNSRFVKVTMENSSYILGVIYEDKLMKYIAYGVPASYNSLPPVDFGQNYQWLPLNPEDIMSDGYFMIYQDATNGQVVNLEIK